MNKLKTRDEIITLIKNHYITDNGVQLFINNVDFLIKEGIIQVAEEEVPEWDESIKDLNNMFYKETEFFPIEACIAKFAFYSWYFNKQANGGVHWVPNWKDIQTGKYYKETESTYDTSIERVTVSFHDKPNFFYFKTPEARETTLAQMTKEELKLLGLEGEG